MNQGGFAQLHLEHNSKVSIQALQYQRWPQFYAAICYNSLGSVSKCSYASLLHFRVKLRSTCTILPTVQTFAFSDFLKGSDFGNFLFCVKLKPVTFWFQKRSVCRWDHLLLHALKNSYKIRLQLLSAELKFCSRWFKRALLHASDWIVSVFRHLKKLDCGNFCWVTRIIFAILFPQNIFENSYFYSRSLSKLFL